MKTTTLAVATLALSATLLVNQDDAFAKGPLLEIEGSSPLILVKETPTELDMKGFPWSLEEGRTENIRMSFDYEVELPDTDPLKVSYVITLPWMEVEKDGDDKITVMMPEDQQMTIVMPIEDEEITLNMETVSEDMVLTFERDDDRMTYTGSAKSFMGSVSSPQAAENGIDLNYTVGGKGLNIEGAGAAEQDWTDIKTLDMDYVYTLDSMVFDMGVSGEGMDGEEIAVKGEAGKMSARGLIRDGRVESGAQVTDFALNILKPLPAEMFFGKFDFDMGMPTKPSPKPQAIKYLIAAEDIQLGETVWGMIDPGEAFPRKLDKLVIDLEMQAMMMVSLFDPESMAEAEASGMPPMMPTSMAINSIAFDGLGLKVDATGEGELKGAVPNGKAYITVKGLSDFVASAQKMGMFGEQEAMMVEGMAGQMGKPGDDGELIFDINTDGGMVNINGAPVMPIPGMQ